VERNFDEDLKIGDLVQCTSDIYVAGVENWVGLVCRVSQDRAYVFWLGVSSTYYPWHPNPFAYRNCELRRYNDCIL